MAREIPYCAFNYVLRFDGDEVFGGFSDVSGIGHELTVAEYRNGNERENHVRKIPGVHKVNDITLKRGIIDSGALWTWIDEVRSEGPGKMKDLVTITLQDEAHNDVQVWELSKVIPSKYTGPTLAAKGGGDVAMEELVLSVEGITIK